MRSPLPGQIVRQVLTRCPSTFEFASMASRRDAATRSHRAGTTKARCLGFIVTARSTSSRYCVGIKLRLLDGVEVDEGLSLVDLHTGMTTEIRIRTSRPSTSKLSTPVPIPTAAPGRSGATGAARAAARARGAAAGHRRADVKSSVRAISARPTSGGSPAQSSIRERSSRSTLTVLWT